MKKIFITYFILLFSFLSLFSSGVLDSIDGLQYLAVSRNIYYQGEPTAPTYEYATRKNLHLSSFVASNGKTYSMTGLGYSVAYLPAVFITDMVYKIYGVKPPQYFPLESDWLILFTASFTNAFFGAALGAILFVYFFLLKLSKKQAILLSFISIVATNLFVYTKHSFAHMAFITLMMLCFLLIKFYSIKKRNYLMFLLGASFGGLSIVYNQTFLLTIIPLMSYYFFAAKPNLRKNWKLELKNWALIMAGLIPFILVYFWYENLRSLPEQNFAGAEFYVNYAAHTASFPISIFIEGIHGQLFSIGRSIFVYSPILLLIIFFWMKIKSIYKAELIAFIVLSIIYIVFYAAQYRVGAPDQGFIANWHGELSWGPRYITPIIPLGMLLVGVIYKYLSKKSKLLIFYPLIAVGIFIQMLGILMPYQIKLHEMEHKIFLNGTEYYSSLYSDFLPRFNPLLNMSKKLNKLRQNFPNYVNNGPYNLRFYDGVDFTFPVGNERWRVIENQGYISFDNKNDTPVKDLTISLKNHPMAESSESASVKIILNGKPLNNSILKVEEKKDIKIALTDPLKEKSNQLIIISKFDNPVEIKFDKNQEVIVAKNQILALTGFEINNQKQNLESIDVPYVSPLGPVLTNTSYQNWGNTNKDPWKIWEIHTQTFERLPDIWWIRNIFYWDIPKSWILTLLFINVAVLLYSGYKLLKQIKD